MLNITYDNCFLINTQPAFNLAAVPPLSHSFSNLSAGPSISPIDSLIEMVLDKGIKVYRDADTVRQISELVAKYPSI